MSKENRGKKVLVTGAAGFIGYFLSRRLLGEGYRVVGLDNINSYYDTGLKYGRLAELGIDRKRVEASSGAEGGALPEAVTGSRYSDFSFYRIDLSNREGMARLFEREGFDRVVNLAAQAGVRYSLENPHSYIESNIDGFLNILEGCRHHPVDHLVYASSSSVYGSNRQMPFKTSHNVDHPVSLYAATKKSNELMAHTYSHLFRIPSTGLRFFTVYGPWGRPDMALFKFADLIMAGKPIDVYNYGKMSRDFTYVDDIVESIVRLLRKPPVAGSANGASATDPAAEPSPSATDAPYKIFNIGHNKPVDLMAFIGQIEKRLGRKAEKNLMEIQPGDVPSTWADVSDLIDWIDYAPRVDMEEGIGAFIDWYKTYYNLR